MVDPQLKGVQVPAARRAPGGADETKPAKFEDFFRAEYQSTVRVVMSAGATKHEADDAVCEAMKLASQRYSTLHTPARWVCIVAVRTYIRRAVRDREIHIREQRMLATTAIDEVDYRDTVTAVREALRSLPVTQRTVMALTIDGYAPSEIAAILDSSADNVRSNLRHARKVMRAALRQGGGSDG